MTALFLKHLHFTYEFPSKNEPSWKDQVDRWYQLDAPAFGLVEAYSQWKAQLPKTPSMILLASPGASNETDRQFAKSGGISPAKFAHTLPNIRCSPLCQIMGWSGPMLSFHRDPHTLVLALREAFELVSAELPSIWVLAGGRSHGHYTVDGFLISFEKDAYSISKRLQKGASSLNASGNSSSLPRDEDFLNWVHSPELKVGKGESFVLPGGYELGRG